MLGFAFWRRQFGADPSIVGRTIFVNSRAVLVVGVVSSGFTGLQPATVDLWLPVEHHAWFFPGSDLLLNPSKKSVLMFGRLRPGLSEAVAEDGLRTLSAEFSREYPGAIGDREWLDCVPAGKAVRLRPSDYSILTFFGALVVLVLAVSLSNAGTLQMARSTVRGHEIWIRVSLGAGRFRIIRQLVTEAVLIASAACGIGLLLSYLGTAIILRSLELPLRVGRGPDWRVAAFAAAVTIVSVALFGLAPAVQLSRHRYGSARARGLFIGIQVMATCVLLIAASLYARGLQRVLTTPHGFEFRDVVAVDPALNSRGYSKEMALVQLAELRRRAEAVPGVRGASVCALLPLSFKSWINGIQGSTGSSVMAHFNSVDPAFFDTMRIALLRGRTFNPGERKAAIVSESLARKAWPGEDPIGKRVTDQGRVVVGVAASARTNALRDGDAVEIYFPVADTNPWVGGGVLLVRTDGPPKRFLPAIRSALQSPNDPPFRFDLLSNLFDSATEGTRKGAAVIAFTGFLTLALAAMGIGGLLSYAVSQRTKEIGIRIALGASPACIVRLVLAQSLRPVGIGLACGLVAGYAISQPLKAQIYGLSRLDAPSYAAAAALLAMAAAIAALFPIRRALRISSAEALRQE